MSITICTYNHKTIHSASTTPDFDQLNNLISDYRLTESLELLDQCGFVGLEGLSAIAFMQCRLTSK